MITRVAVLASLAAAGCFDLGARPAPGSDGPSALPDSMIATDADSDGAPDASDCTCNSMCAVDETVAGPLGLADVEPIFSESCAVAGPCHAGGAAGAGEDLTPGGICASVIGVVATQTSPTTMMPRITPGDPEASYLFHKLRGTHRGAPIGMGCRMPLGGCCLSAEEIGRIRRWILDGAACP